MSERGERPPAELTGGAARAPAPGIGLLPRAAGAVLVALLLLPSSARPQERTASRVASLVQLAVTEYRDAVRGGEVVNRMEYDEAEAFASQARDLYSGLLEERPDPSPRARELLGRFGDLLRIVRAKGPVADFREQADRLVRELTRMWGAAPIQMPERPPSAAAGAQLYQKGCVPCHGPAGRGDGWAADNMEPRPPDLASDRRRREATAARDYQVITYGVPRTAMPESGHWLSVEERWDLVAYLQSLRFTGAQVTVGKSLSLDTAAAAESAGSAAVASRLRTWGSVEGSLRLTDRQLTREVQRAWRRAAGDSLGRRRAASVVGYARSLLGSPAAGVPEPDRTRVLTARLATVDSLVGESVALHREGRADAARGRALEGYMAFEDLEPTLRARAPNLVSTTEAAFARFRNAIGEPGFSKARGQLRTQLSRVRDELNRDTGAWSVAGQSFFIILREGFEAILIIGAILAFLVKTGNEERRRSVYGGVGLALLASALTAVAIETIFAFGPADREVLEGATLLLATAVLFSVSYWILSKLEHQKWEAYLREKTTEALGAGSGLALAGVAFLAVYREGFETVLFYKALLISPGGGIAPVALGFLAGCVALAAIYVAFTRYGLQLPMRPFFAVTSAVLYYMAVVFAGQGISELQAAGTVSYTPVPGVPRVDLLGLYPTAETLAAQGVLVALLVAALYVTFRGTSPGGEASAAGASGAASA